MNELHHFKIAKMFTEQEKKSMFTQLERKKSNGG
jgi:hypothetical protein